jgi:hypothetical protein
LVKYFAGDRRGALRQALAGVVAAPHMPAARYTLRAVMSSRLRDGLAIARGQVRQR